MMSKANDPSCQFPKMVREALCAAQDCVAARHRNELQYMIDQIDLVRPLGYTCTHGDRRCTPNCGCDGHIAPWSIEFFPQRDE